MKKQPLEIVKKIVWLAGQVIECGEPVGEINDQTPSEYIIPAKIYDELFAELGKLDQQKGKSVKKPLVTGDM